MPPAPGETLVRAAVLWVLGFLLIAGVSAYLAQRTRTKRSGIWVGAILVSLGQLSTAVGALAVGKAIADFIDDSAWLAPAAGPFVIIGLVWGRRSRSRWARTSAIERWSLVLTLANEFDRSDRPRCKARDQRRPGIWGPDLSAEPPLAFASTNAYRAARVWWETAAWQMHSTW